MTIEHWMIVALSVALAASLGACLWLWRRIPQYPCFYVPKGHVVTMRNMIISNAPGEIYLEGYSKDA